MNTIPVKNFINGVCQIALQKPSYKHGHDGSTNYCDEMGLIRGALLRSGATMIKDMKDINQCAQCVLLDIHPVDDLVCGDIVLQTANTLRYSINGDWNNYYNIGVVVNEQPLEIVYMTRRGIKRSRKPTEWDFVGRLPQVEENRKTGNAVISSTDSFIKAYESPSFSCKVTVNIPNGEAVNVVQRDTPWSIIDYNGDKWCVFSKYLVDAPQEKDNDIVKELEEIYERLGELLERLKPEKK